MLNLNWVSKYSSDAHSRFVHDCAMARLWNAAAGEIVVEFRLRNILLIEGNGMNTDFLALWERHEDGWKTRTTNVCVEHYDASGTFRGIELVIQQHK